MFFTLYESNKKQRNYENWDTISNNITKPSTKKIKNLFAWFNKKETLIEDESEEEATDEWSERKLTDSNTTTVSSSHPTMEDDLNHLQDRLENMLKRMKELYEQEQLEVRTVFEKRVHFLDSKLTEFNSAISEYYMLKYK